MGLDMYLYAEKYVGGWEHGSDEERERFTAVLETMGMADLVTDESPSLEVRVTVAYWRKANAIHRWFVENVQGGKDECQMSYVDPEQLEALRDQCRKALAAKEKVGAGVAEELVPTQSGFFFGSTDYDEWYWRDLEDTVKQLDRVLKLTADRPLDLYYRSSW